MLGPALAWLAVARQCFADPCGGLTRGLLTSVFALVVGLAARLLPADAAPLGPDVAAVDLDQPLPGQAAQPGVERQRPPLRVVGKFQVRLGQGVLDDVGGVEAWPQPAVEANLDHVAQALAVPGQQSAAGVGVARGDAAQQLVGLFVARGTHADGLLPLILPTAAGGHTRRLLFLATDE
jgi:hypothetical protein